jgi:methionyl-tRNA synthetase
MKQRSNNPKTSRKSKTKSVKTKMKAKGAEARGSRCAACGKKFQPYAPQHNFCSPACRQRAFYWEYKERTGKRYASRNAGRPAARRSARRTTKRSAAKRTARRSAS